LACCASPQTPPPLPTSGEEAEAPAIALEGGAYVKPPRTIADVLARAPVGAERPACAAPAAPATFERHWIAVAAADREFRSGDAGRALRLIERSLDLAETPRQREASLGTQAYYLARAGLTRRADDALAAAGAAAGGAETTSAEAASMALLPQRLLGRAAILEAKGDDARAEAAYREVREASRRIAPGGYLDNNIDLDVARTALSQGRRIEAEALLREALERTPSFALEDGTRRWIASEHLAAKVGLLAETLVEQGRFAEAAQAAQRAMAIAVSVCIPEASPALAEHRDAHARALALSLRWPEAAQEYERAASALAPPEFSAARFGAHHLFGLALVKSGRPAEGARLLQAAVEAAERRAGGDEYALAERRALLAIALLALDRRGEAFEQFAAAMPRLFEGAASGEEGDVAGSGQTLLRIIVDSYIDALHELRGSPLPGGLPGDAVDEAFRAADAVRSRAVQKALALADSRIEAERRGLSDLVRRRHQAARRQVGEQAAIAELYARLSSPGLEAYRGEIQAEIATRAARAAELRRTRASLDEALDRRFPEYRRIVTPRPGSLDEVRGLLTGDEALVAVHATDRATYVWAARAEGPVQAVAVGLTRAELREEAARLRRALAPEQIRSIGDIPPYDVRGARRLYDLLIAPIEPTLARVRTLIVAPEEALAPLPLAALVRGGEAADATVPFAGYRGVRWLAETHAVAGTPSVGSLASLRRLESSARRAGGSFLGFGDPRFDGAPDGRLGDGARRRPSRLMGKCVRCPAHRSAPSSSARCLRSPKPATSSSRSPGRWAPTRRRASFSARGRPRLPSGARGSKRRRPSPSRRTAWPPATSTAWANRRWPCRRPKPTKATTTGC
jgi:tetratricopeptide (TPR) repeat protein